MRLTEYKTYGFSKEQLERIFKKKIKKFYICDMYLPSLTIEFEDNSEYYEIMPCFILKDLYLSKYDDIHNMRVKGFFTKTLIVVVEKDVDSKK